MGVGGGTDKPSHTVPNDAVYATKCPRADATACAAIARTRSGNARNAALTIRPESTAGTLNHMCSWKKVARKKYAMNLTDFQYSLHNEACRR